MSVEPTAEWTGVTGGLTAADLDHLPDLPPHTELIDGGLVFESPQRRFHEETLTLLRLGLKLTVPPDLFVVREMSIVLGDRQRPEPDLSVIERRVVGDGNEMWYPGDAVRLVVEVVSPESRGRDRTRKPQLYAAAGIPHFWVVEESSDRPVVYVYELDPSRQAYNLAGIYHDRLKLNVPFSIDIALED